jgi:hypothetical protein
MPQGQFYPGQKLVEESVVQDALFTYTQGLASKSVNPITPAFNGSGTAVSNTNAYNVNVYMYGGSVSSVLINSGTVGISISGTVSNSNLPVVNTHYFLKPGDTITPTWAGANTPTWLWQAE